MMNARNHCFIMWENSALFFLPLIDIAHIFMVVGAVNSLILCAFFHVAKSTLHNDALKRFNYFEQKDLHRRWFSSRQKKNQRRCHHDRDPHSKKYITSCFQCMCVIIGAISGFFGACLCVVCALKCVSKWTSTYRKWLDRQTGLKLQWWMSKISAIEQENKDPRL